MGAGIILFWSIFVVACMVFSYLAQGYFVSVAYFDQKAMENRLLYTKSNDKAKSDNEAKSNETIGNNFAKLGILKINMRIILGYGLYVVVC